MCVNVCIFRKGISLKRFCLWGCRLRRKHLPNFQSFHLRKFIMRNFKILHCLRNLPPTRLYEYITIPATGSFLRTHGDSEYKTERYLHRTALFFIFNINRSIILLFFIYSPIFLLSFSTYSSYILPKSLLLFCMLSRTVCSDNTLPF